MENFMQLRLPAISENESFARSVVSAFAVRLDPTVEQLNDVRTAVSEAVTNCVVHAYRDTPGEIELYACIEGRVLTVRVTDYGCGIEDIETARQPFFTTATTEERSGMGFTVMETFMDSMEVASTPDCGTQITLKKGF